jgi:hypothetical protein
MLQLIIFYMEGAYELWQDDCQLLEGGIDTDTDESIHESRVLVNI